MKNNVFRFVVGVDQTGAKGPKGRAKALPVSLMIQSKVGWRLSSPHQLKALDKKNILELLEEVGLKSKWENILIVADCVLGLPQKIVSSKNPLKLLHRAMDKAAAFNGMGLHAGELFFKDCFQEAEGVLDQDLLRNQEKELGCLSVFKNKPFQRNVQTGTYRIWSDLGRDENYKDFNIWPYEQKTGKAYLCEGYPAHAKKFIDQNQKIVQALDIENMKLYQEISSDHKDAAALAVLGALFFEPKNEIKFKKEGWILTA